MPVSYIFFITSSNYDLYRAEDNQIQFIGENAFDHLNAQIRTDVNLERNICIIVQHYISMVTADLKIFALLQQI